MGTARTAEQGGDENNAHADETEGFVLPKHNTGEAEEEARHEDEVQDGPDKLQVLGVNGAGFGNGQVRREMKAEDGAQSNACQHNGQRTADPTGTEMTGSGLGCVRAHDRVLTVGSGVLTFVSGRLKVRLR